MNRGSSDTKQLHTLVRHLRTSVSSSDVALITGLSITKSLEGVSLDQQVDLKQQELACVYKGIDESIQRRVAGKTPNGIVMSYLDALRPVFQAGEYDALRVEQQSPLFQKTLANLERGYGSFSDQLSRRASRLIRKLHESGPVSVDESIQRDYRYLDIYFAGDTHD